MTEDQQYVPPPRSGHGGMIVGIAATLMLLLVIGMVLVGGSILIHKTNAIEMQQRELLQMELQARMEAERARAEAESARAEALRSRAQLQQIAPAAETASVETTPAETPPP